MRGMKELARIGLSFQFIEPKQFCDALKDAISGKRVDQEHEIYCGIKDLFYSMPDLSNFKAITKQIISEESSLDANGKRRKVRKRISKCKKLHRLFSGHTFPVLGIIWNILSDSRSTGFNGYILEATMAMV